MSRKTIAPNSFAAIRVFAFKPFANCAVMPVFDFEMFEPNCFKGKKQGYTENAESRRGREEVRGVRARENKERYI